MELRSERLKQLYALEKNPQLAGELKLSNQIFEDANSRLERIAIIDSLTEILNCPAFEDRITATLFKCCAKESLALCAGYRCR